MNLLTLEDEKFKNVTIYGYDFKIRYISPMDRVLITQKRMNLQNGKPVSMLTEDEYAFFENIAMIDTCVEKMPDNFKEHESCINWEDIGMIGELAMEIIKFTNEIQAKLKKNRPVKRSAEQ